MSEYPVLDRLQAPSSLHALSAAELDALCAEIRRFLVEHISKTGGHLASNLGIVELTVALHLEFDTSRDRLLFDVGHQCYVHKLLTGRRDGFAHLRGFGGMSGFPKPSESPHDAFVAGHASTSVSAATGMARARTLMGERYHVVAVIGDGALTGGMAYEALNDAGRSGEPLIVILNDNTMSISPNVGAIAVYLAKLRLKPSYFRLKQATKKVIARLPFGGAINGFFHRVKENFKNMVLPASLFESMGFNYVGPVDGHNIKNLREMLQYAKLQTRPTLIHCRTVKGKGYKYSEERPDRYHGTVEFNVESGRAVKKEEHTFSGAFGDAMFRLARDNPRVVAVTAAMPAGTGLLSFAKAFPERFFDVGIAEEHAVTMAAGMAKQGLCPVCAIYSTFLQRAYDQIIHDVAIERLHVVLAIDRAGVVGGDGETHQGVFDCAFLCGIPHMTVLCPANEQELSSALDAAVNRMDGPVAIRYAKGPQGRFLNDLSGKRTAVVREGVDITVVAYGVLINEALDAAAALAAEGICAEVVKLFSIKPLELEPVIRSVSRTGLLLVAEEGVPEGGVGERVLAGLAARGCAPRGVRLLNIGERFLPNGSVPDLLKFCGLDAAGIAGAARELIGARGLRSLPASVRPSEKQA